MAAPSNHWKLGLFVVAGLAVAMAALTVIGARSMQQDVGLYVSYFDESVQGLEVGSPIKFRGVTIGTVGKIRVASDHRHIEVESELGVDELTRLGLDIPKERPPFGAPRRLAMTADLRLQLASAGLTGVKFLQLDFFDAAQYPAPMMPFAVPENYIPTVPSMMKGLEDSIILIADRLPEIADQVASIAGEVEVIVSDVSDQQLPDQISVTFETMNRVLLTAQKAIEQAGVQKLSRNTNQTLDSITGAAERFDEILARISQENGLLSSLGRTSDSLGDTLHNAEGVGAQLIDTLESIDALSRSLRKLSEALEQDPDMWLKGRSPEKKR